MTLPASAVEMHGPNLMRSDMLCIDLPTSFLHVLSRQWFGFVRVPGLQIPKLSKPAAFGLFFGLACCGATRDLHLLLVTG